MVEEAEETAGITAPQCGSWGCSRMGLIKSEEYGMRLCAHHAIEGPEPRPECTCAMTESSLRACPVHGENAPEY